MKPIDNFVNVLSDNELEMLHEKYGNQGFSVIGLSVDESGRKTDQHAAATQCPEGFQA